MRDRMMRDKGWNRLGRDGDDRDSTYETASFIRYPYPSSDLILHPSSFIPIILHPPTTANNPCTSSKTPSCNANCW